MPTPIVLVHGGAGLYSEGRYAEAASACVRGAEAGAKVLSAGGSALDAVCEAVRVLEDEPELNAGTGSALNRDGDVEMDACVMDGRDLRSGAVAMLRGIRNPVLGARAVMEQSDHVFIGGEGARQFLLSKGFAPYPAALLVTPRNLERHLANRPSPKHGTVGAVAFDRHGHLAAATSTGGTDGKLPGRIGDSPIPGAGTFADNLRAAASATGVGERILRFGLTRTACDLVASGLAAQAAVERALAEFRTRTEGEAGLILLSPRGELGLSRTTPRMSWAWRDLEGRGDGQCA